MLPDALSDLLYHRSGLFGLSGLSGDTRDLLESNAPQAREALEVFTLRIAGEIARLVSTLGGLDALIFTAGIGNTSQRFALRFADASLGWASILIPVPTIEMLSGSPPTRAVQLRLFLLPTKNGSSPWKRFRFLGTAPCKP